MLWIVLIIAFLLLQSNPNILTSISSGLSGGSIPYTPPPGYKAITVDRAWDLATATEGRLNPKDFANKDWVQLRKYYITTLQLDVPTDCGNPTQASNGSRDLSLGQATAGTGLNIASSFATAGSTLATTIPFIGAGIGIVTSIIGVIFAHHAAAVARDKAAACSCVPSAINALNVLVVGVQNGQIHPEMGIAGLQVLPEQFLQCCGPAKNNSPWCNALCVELITLRAICFYWRSQFGDTTVQ